RPLQRSPTARCKVGQLPLFPFRVPSSNISVPERLRVTFNPTSDLGVGEFQSDVDFISLNESIDTSSPMGKMIFTVLGAVAESERNIIRERVTAGLKRAKKEGKTLGRPKVIVNRERVRELYKQGDSVRAIASKLGLKKSTVHSIVTSKAPSQG